MLCKIFIAKARASSINDICYVYAYVFAFFGALCG